MENPLLDINLLPPFSRIRPEHVEPAIDQVLTENRATLNALLERGGPYTWDNLIQPLEEMEDRLNRTWSPARHLNAVMNSDELRAAYNAAFQLSSMRPRSVRTALFTRHTDHRAEPRVRAAEPRPAQDRKCCAIFTLPAWTGPRIRLVTRRFSKSCPNTSRFEESVLDAPTAGSSTSPMSRTLRSSASAQEMAYQAAQQGAEGWLFALEFPSYFAVINYADDSSLRRGLGLT
jgi:oligopeptidase A